MKRNICVYCGAAEGNPGFKEAAEHAGRALVRGGMNLVYGGGQVGLMKVIADAVMSEGGHVTGFMPKFLHEIEIGHPEISDLRIVENMHERKMGMFSLADGFLVLPGGFGTLEEFFEMLTWKQLGLHEKPIVLLNVKGIWDPLRSLLEHLVGSGFVRPELLDLFEFVDSVEDAIACLRQ